MSRGDFIQGLVLGLQASFVARPHAVSFCESIPLFVYLFAERPVTTFCISALRLFIRTGEPYIFLGILVRVKSVWILVPQFRVDKFV